MGFIENLAVLTIGIVIGLVIGLVSLFKRRTIPKPVPVDKLDAWKHLGDLAKEKAELLAKKEVLKQAYSKGEIDEKGYVGESSKLDSLLDSLQNDMNETMYMIAKGLVPKFMLDTEKERLKLEEAIKLSNRIKSLEDELEKAKGERDSMYMQVNELENEKKDILAKYNWLKENSTKQISDMQNKIKKLEDKVITLERENQALNEEVGEATKPESERLKNLKAENELLKEELENQKKKLNIMQKELAVLSTIIKRYENEIRKGETKTIEEMKNFITPDDESVKSLLKTYNNPRSAYEYVKDNITEIIPVLGLAFWMKPSEVIRNGAGDNDDRAMLLASMLRGLGIDASVLFVETTKGENRALVLANTNGKYYLLDLDKNRKFDDFVGDSKKEVISKYTTGHGSVSKIRYEITDKEVRVEQ